MAGLFWMFNTYGLPLSVCLDAMNQKNTAVCWPSFIEDARAAGWSDDAIISRMEEAIVDVHGKGYWEQVKERVKLI